MTTATHSTAMPHLPCARIEPRGSVLSHAVGVLTMISVLALMRRDLEGIMPIHGRQIALSMLGAWCLFFRARLSREALGASGAIVLAIGFALVLLPFDAYRWTLGTVLVLTGVARAHRSDTVIRRGVPIFLALDTLVRFGAGLSPWLWRWIEAPGAWWSTSIGAQFAEQPLQLGYSAQGLPIVITLGIWVIVRFCLVDRRFIRCAAALLLLAVIHGATLAYFHRITGDAHSHAAVVWLSRVGWIPAALIIAWVTSTRLADGREKDDPPWSNRRFAWCAAGAATVLASSSLTADLPFRTNERHVVFYSANEGPILNWDRPDYDSFGPFSHGMFGLLPEYLERDGYEIAYLRDRIVPSALADADVLVTINVNTDWEDDELETVWSFVRAGGTLLVLGDHTDVEGSQHSQNRLLEPSGIRFRFDSAVASPVGGWWNAALPFHPVTSGVSHGGELGICVGASLELSGSRARPLVIGSLGLSDAGDRDATDRAFLGNYECDPGESVGEIALVAHAKFGRGRMLVFGDTSSFQNPSMTEGYDSFVRRVFSWSTSPVLTVPRRPLECATALGFAMLLALLATGGLPWFAGPCVLAVLVASVAGMQQLHRAADSRELHAPSRIAWIDQSHGPRVDYTADGKNTVNALSTSLMRSGCTVRYLTRFDLSALGPNDVLVILAPVEEYRDNDVAAIERFVERGGGVLIAAGRPAQEPIEKLLGAFHLRIGDQPVGPVPLHRSRSHLRVGVEYVEAWPIEVLADDAGGLALVHDPGAAASVDQQTTVYGFFRGTPLAVMARKGRGGLFLVADSYFFSDANLEHQGDVALPNIYLLRRVLNDLFRTGGIS